MPKTIADVMTRNVISLPLDATAADAARHMKDSDIGPVIVLDQDRVCGIVTDRDIVVRAIAEGKDPTTTKLSEIVSTSIETVSPGDSVEEALRIMQMNAVRRLPVCEGDRAVGMVSIGDIATERGDAKAVGETMEEISDAPPQD